MILCQIILNYLLKTSHPSKVSYLHLNDILILKRIVIIYCELDSPTTRDRLSRIIIKPRETHNSGFLRGKSWDAHPILTWSWVCYCSIDRGVTVLEIVQQLIIGSASHYFNIQFTWNCNGERYCLISVL